MRSTAAFIPGLALVTALHACVGDEPGGAPAPREDASLPPQDSAPPPPPPPPPDSSLPDAAVRLDAAPDASSPPCDPTADFGNVTPLAGLEAKLLALNAQAKQWLDATLTDDERLLLFSACDSPSNVDATCDIYQAALSAGVVTDVKKVDALSSSSAFERHPTLSPDAKRVFLLRGPKIYTASRSDPLGPFGPPVVVDSLDIAPPVFDSDPFLARSGKLYFMRGSGARTVHYATVSATAIDGARQLAADLVGLDPIMADVGNEKESLLFLAKIESGAQIRRVIYTSERSGATWSALGQKFVGAVNDANTSNFVNWVSKDACRLYFSRGTGVAGPFKIYVADRKK